MRYICDFHIHSRYSRATSPQMNLEDLNYWAGVKGIQILGTGDFTHPIWFSEIKKKLEPAESGLYRLKSQFLNPKSQTNPNSQILNSQNETRFILTAEISCIYSKGGKGRRIHLVVFMPDIASVEKFNTQLSWIGNLKSDGRPILGADAKDILKIALDVSADTLVVPAHVWTPWFSVFGSKSGFNSIKECFDELSPYIYTIETGLSSDPPMNWRLSQLDKLSLISNSDAHSPKNLGREATVFSADLPAEASAQAGGGSASGGDFINYKNIIEAIKNGSPHQRQAVPSGRDQHQLSLAYTIEFFPEEGKYHYDGHRLCNVSFSPAETKKRGGICPVCGKPMVIGVLNRVDELADRKEEETLSGRIPFKSLVPLQEIIAESLGVEKLSKKVEEEYFNLVNKGGTEFNILLDLNENQLRKIASEKIVEGIIKMREGQVQKIPGYDGVYGKISVFSTAEVKPIKQGSLFK